MQAFRLIEYCYLAYFSKPASERCIYQAIRRRKACNLVELGTGPALRARRMIRVAQLSSPGRKVRYTGIDEFELAGRAGDVGSLPLKAAHQHLAKSGAQVQLVPGDPFTALARKANDLVGSDLLVISANQRSQLLDRAWFYVPRMLHVDSLVFVEDTGQDDPQQSRFRLLPHEQIQELAGAGLQRRAA